MPSRFEETRKALGTARAGGVRSGAMSLVARAERAIDAGDKKRAASLLVSLASTAINFPSILSKKAAIATIVAVLVDAKRAGVNVRRLGLRWDKGRRCSTAGDRRCFKASGFTCYEDSTGCISTAGNAPAVLVNARVAPG
jgi:hypothetical protein